MLYRVSEGVMKGKQKFHYAGIDEEGKATFVECRSPKGDDDIVTVVKGRPAEAGKAPPLGSRLAFIHQEGTHYSFEDAATGADPISGEGGSEGKGPVQIATHAYREGWEATFGKSGVN